MGVSRAHAAGRCHRLGGKPVVGSGTPPCRSRAVQAPLADARGNPNWFAQRATATDAGLLRELVIMQAFQLELARKNTDLLDYLTRMEGTTGREMNDLYTRMVGAQQ